MDHRSRRRVFVICSLVLLSLMACLGGTIDQLDDEIAKTQTAVKFQTDIALISTQLAAKQTQAARPTALPVATLIPTPRVIRVGVGETADFTAFKFSVTKAEYMAPNPKGAFFITVLLENKSNDPLPYSAKDFSVTSSAGEHKLLVLPKSSGAAWSDDFAPNSQLLPMDQASLQFLAELQGDEENFVFALVWLQYRAEVNLGR